MLFVSGQDKQRVLVFRIDLQGFVSPLHGFLFFDTVVFVDESDVDIGFYEMRLEFYNFAVLSNCLFIDGRVEQDVRIAEMQLVVVGIFEQHLFEPLLPLLIFFVFGVAKR